MGYSDKIWSKLQITNTKYANIVTKLGFRRSDILQNLVGLNFKGTNVPTVERLSIEVVKMENNKEIIQLSWEEYVDSVMEDGEISEEMENEIIEFITDIIEIMLICSIINEPEKEKGYNFFMENNFYKNEPIEKIKINFFTTTQRSVV